MGFLSERQVASWTIKQISHNVVFRSQGIKRDQRAWFSEKENRRKVMVTGLARNSLVINGKATALAVPGNVSLDAFHNQLIPH